MIDFSIHALLVSSLPIRFIFGEIEINMAHFSKEFNFYKAVSEAARANVICFLQNQH